MLHLTSMVHEGHIIVVFITRFEMDENPEIFRQIIPRLDKGRLILVANKFHHILTSKNTFG